MLRSGVIAAAAAAAALALAAGGGAATTVSVDPSAGTPDTAFHVEVAALYKVRQLRDRYRFIVHGPGGESCEGSVTERVGVIPAPRAATAGVDLPGVRVVTKRQVVPGPWCPGTFSGRVEFRDWRPKPHRYIVHRMGLFSFEVKAS
jgi:hypothetical protein